MTSPDPLDAFATLGLGLLAGIVVLAIVAATVIPFLIPLVRFL